MSFGANGKAEKTAKPFEGLIPQMQRLYEETESEFTRNRIRSFMTRVPCHTCKGARLKPEILAVTIKDATERQLKHPSVLRADDRRRRAIHRQARAHGSAAEDRR
jgi:excinuclease ABC subunit A